MLAVVAMADPEASDSNEAPSMFDDYLAKTCKFCTEDGIEEDTLLCAGFFDPLCASAKMEDKMVPGYCGPCHDYFDYQKMNPEARAACIERVIRFSTSDTCVDSRVNEARSERARRDARKQAIENERRDDARKEKAARDAQRAANDAHAARVEADRLAGVAESMEDAAEDKHQNALGRKADAKQDAIDADVEAAKAKAAAEAAEIRRQKSFKVSERATKMWEDAVAAEAAAKAAAKAADMHAVALQDEADRLRRIADRS